MYQNIYTERNEDYANNKKLMICSSRNDVNNFFLLVFSFLLIIIKVNLIVELIFLTYKD